MYISVKHDSIAKYWETARDFFTCELGAYVNDIGQIVIPAPYYAVDQNDYIFPTSWSMKDFTKEEALKDFARNCSGKLENKYFYKLHKID